MSDDERPIAGDKVVCTDPEGATINGGKPVPELNKVYTVTAGGSGAGTWLIRLEGMGATVYNFRAGFKRWQPVDIMEITRQIAGRST